MILLSKYCSSKFKVEISAVTVIAEHLKSSARHLYLLQYLGLDLVAFYATMTYGIFKVLSIISQRMKEILLRRDSVKRKHD